MIVVIVALFLLLAPAHIALSEYAVDDAFIHFRIAQNFVEYGAPFFNTGEPVLATSSIVWTLVLTSLFSITGLSIVAVSVLNAFLLSVNAVLWPLVIPPERRNWRLHSGPIAVIVLAVMFGSSTGLMETPLAMALVAGGFVLKRKTPLLGVVLLSVAVFTRLEAVVFLFAYLVIYCQRDMFQWLKGGAIIGLTATPFVLFELHFFGTLIPHTVIAKSVVYTVTATDFVHFVFHGIFGSELMGHHKNVIAALVGVALLGLLVLIFTEKKFSAYASVIKRDVEIVALAASAFVILFVYFVKKVHLASWYMPLYEIPLLILLLLVCARRHRFLLTVIGAICISPFVFQLLRCGISVTGQLEYYPGFAEGARVRQYRSVSQQLAQKYPDATLMTSEIGGIGYGFKGHILDGAGLITPAALEFHPLDVPTQRPSGVIGAIPAAFIREQRPEIILSLDVFITEFLNSDLVNDYKIERRDVFRSDDQERWAESGIWGANYLIVAVRKDI
jgi:hypothetical protein